ncbi:uncharacterized protein LOC123439171 [Hordeum vulgare subsp. vulgare]|uniref:Uncharacterized protein n=1 Tax=Hordeum vulgare subsp. vulgare TaxID=112509 RepID=A0A8I6X1R0_HORVV|nr:uncharacterized protein LOC123439171 [Hordeum vulgare subsp. vulgare]
MESVESFCEKYFPNSSFGDIYSLDEFIDPSRTSDQELVSNLTSISHMRKEEMEVYRLGNPGVGLSKFYFFRQARVKEGFDTETASLREAAANKIRKAAYASFGEWHKETMFAIPNTSQGNSPNSPKFVGTKTTMEFKPTDGTNAVVGMTRYNLLRTMKDRPGLYLEEDLSLCHIYPLEGKNKAGPKRKRKGTDEGPLNTKDYIIDGPVGPRADQWDSFTKIYTKNPQLMYAACNHCNTMLKLSSKRGAASGCGTSSLESHSESAKCRSSYPTAIQQLLNMV